MPYPPLHHHLLQYVAATLQILGARLADTAEQKLTRDPERGSVTIEQVMWAVAMIAIVPMVNVFSVAVLAHYASPEKRSSASIVVTVASNPLIWACAIGLALNVAHIPLPRLWHEVADALGRSSLAIGLLVTGAGLHLEGLFRPSLAASVTVFLKLVLMPLIAVALALWFGITGPHLAIVTVCAAVPTASSAYVLARQMGGDAPLLAQIITLQTILAAITMPVAIALAAMC